MPTKWWILLQKCLISNPWTLSFVFCPSNEMSFWWERQENWLSWGGQPPFIAGMFVSGIKQYATCTPGNSFFFCCQQGLSTDHFWISWDKTRLLSACVTRLMCSQLAGNFWSTPVLVHKGLIHGVTTSLPWQTGLQSWQSCTIVLAHSVGYKWRSYQDSLSEGLISYMWIQSDSDLTGSINFQGVCVTRLMCSPLAGNFWSTPVLVHKGLIHGVMTSLPWQTGLQSWQSCTIALAHSVGYMCYPW